jgi:hypothetical protein
MHVLAQITLLYSSAVTGKRTPLSALGPFAAAIASPSRPSIIAAPVFP